MSKIMLGAMCDDSTEGNESVTNDQIKSFINKSGKGLATVYFTDKWAQNPELKFPISKARTCTINGAVPFIRIQNSEDEDGAPGSAGKFSWKNILDGRFDKELKFYGVGLDMFQDTVIIEIGTEINGGWFSWSDEGPELFKKGFRYIVKMFRNENTKFRFVAGKKCNIKFAFHCDATDNDKSKDWFPGNDVVDWVGTSCYGGYGSGKGCIDTLDDCYEDFAAISKTARLGIFEYGAPDPKDMNFNVEDTRKTLELLPKKYPRIELLQRWAEKVVPEHGEDRIGDGRIDVTPEMLKAYREGIANPVYVDKYFE